MPEKLNMNGNKIISIAHMIGGALGLIMLLPQLPSAASLFPLGLLFLLIIQVVGALYGGWKLWKGETIGYQIVYWVCLSCIPVISFPFLRYWSSIGVGLFPSFSLGSYTGFHLNFNFGYDSQLWLNPNDNGLTIGVNVVSLIMLISLKNIMTQRDIKTWPLAFPQYNN